MSQATKQVKAVAQAAPRPNQGFETTAFFDANGNAIDLAGLVARAEALEAAAE